MDFNIAVENTSSGLFLQILITILPLILFVVSVYVVFLLVKALRIYIKKNSPTKWIRGIF